MQIVEYSNKYAKKLADLWNRSRSNWGNSDDYTSEEDVINTEGSSGNIKTYIALDKDEVVGYCSFSEYSQDTGASYLPLINVRPDYHGKKVGKALILKVLEDAKKSKWPRFDLYTWSGNIKAMPLYKKCGFFWERRNNTVHLMNFIPYLTQTEALKPYVNKLDLYRDSIRKIDMDYDGIDENGFDIYYYHFKNELTYLNLGFEKTGRGLVYIDNPDYEIRLVVGSHKLVYGRGYDGQLEIVNKSGKCLDIEIQGVGNQTLVNSVNQSFEIRDALRKKVPFFVEENDQIQDPGKTHPCVELNVHINGKNAVLKCGVLAKSPIEMHLRTVELIHLKGVVYYAYIDLENNLDKETMFHIQLPESNIRFLGGIDITLGGGEKRSVKIAYIVNKFGFYNELALISYKDQTIKKTISGIFKGSKESFVCDLEKEIHLVSGNSMLTYKKDSHNLRYYNTYNLKNDISLMPPKIGEPFSLEFNNIDPEIKIISDQEMLLSFESETFKRVFININIRNHYGILELSYELVNKGIGRVFSMSIPVMKSIGDSYIPYQARMLKTDGQSGYIGYLNINNIDERWIYSDLQKQGFSWPENVEIKLSDWYVSFNVDKIHLEENGRYKTGNFIVSYVHPSLKDFRRFVGSKDERDIFTYMELEINNFNPIIKDKAEVKLINHRKAIINGTISNGHGICDISESLCVGAGLQRFTIDLSDRLVEMKRLLFKPYGKVLMHEASGIYTVNNGVLSYKADINHSDSVFSLVFNGHEWIDSNYPEPKERAWWGSFVGGLAQRMSGIQDIVAIKEKRSIDFVSIKDNFKNLWQGLKISTYYQSDPVYKGLSTDYYILTMPSLPFLYSFTVVRNNSGSLIQDKYMHRRYTLMPGVDRKKIRVRVKDTVYKIEDQSLELDIKRFISFENSTDHHMVFYGKTSEFELDSQKAYIMVFAEEKMTIPDQEYRIFSGEYLLFTEESLKADDLSLLDYIKFTF